MRHVPLGSDRPRVSNMPRDGSRWVCARCGATEVYVARPMPKLTKKQRATPNAQRNARLAFRRRISKQAKRDGWTAVSGVGRICPNCRAELARTFTDLWDDREAQQSLRAILRRVEATAPMPKPRQPAKDVVR